MGKIIVKSKQAKVKYGEGLTLSKNYQSFRIDAGIELDCDISEIPATFERAKKLVEKQLEKSIEENKTLLGDLSKVLGVEK